MIHRAAVLAFASLGAVLVSGCADGSTGLLSTAAINSPTAAPKVDPACVALTARIDALRKEGFVESFEKASAGKSASVTVKRESLAKMTELDRANAEFQAKCAAAATTAGVTPPKAAATVAAVQPAVPAAKP